MRIRLKLAILFTALTLVLLVGIGAFFLLNLRSGLQSSMDNSLRTRADEVIAQLGASRPGDSAGIRLVLAHNSYGQVLTTSGTVTESTDDTLDGPLLTPSQAVAAARGQRLFDATVHPATSSANGELGPQRVRVLAAPSGQAGNVVAVATSREVVDEAMERAAKELLVVGAIVLLLAGPGSWLLVRATLRPVERMRAQAAELQTRDAGAGLSVPDTGDEIARLAETLNGLLTRLHGAVEHERAFVADAGHELRTPLTVLRGELELARRPGRTLEQLSETVEIAAEETERLVRLAEDLLVLARDEQALPIRRHSFDVRAVAEAARAAATSAAAGRSVSLQVIGPQTLAAGGDPDRIRQAVDNLLSNAVRFSPPGGVVGVELSRTGAGVEVSVTDDGPGFAADLLPYAFERFRRGDTARTRDADARTAGTGLGLAIVSSILRGHGGTATASNRTGAAGARVTLRWPAEPAGD